MRPTLACSPGFAGCFRCHLARPARMTLSHKPAAELSRSELHARLRSQSKDALILEDMQRLGFWPSNQGQPDEVAELIARENTLVQTLTQLRQQLARVGDPEQALKDMRRQRMAAAKARREATRQARAQQRHARALAWHAQRQSAVLYLGAAVSGGLHAHTYDAARLARWQLPELPNAQALAQAAGVTVAELRFLAYDRPVSTISHYRRFQVPKKSGGVRTISAPMPRLKRLQYWVLDHILSRVPLHDAAHGFRPGRSIVSNATPHAGRAVVVNLDIQDFFPSIAYPRIKGVFRTLGYSEHMASLLSLLCTERPTQEAELDGARYIIATGERHLPQGAPTSPALTNILCYTLDRRLAGMAAKLGFTYTRYADDLSFSADGPAQRQVGKLLWRARRILQDEGFTPHPDKQHVMRAHQHQSVTGLVVNAKPSIDRATFKRFRATVYQVEKDGPAGKHWGGNSDVVAALLGYAHFLHMVDAPRGAPWLARVQALHQHYRNGHTGIAPSPGNRRAFRAASRAGQAPWAPWWQPAAPAAPQLETTDAQRRALVQQRAQAQRQARAGQRPPGDNHQQQPPHRQQQPAGISRALAILNHPLVLQLAVLAIFILVTQKPQPSITTAVAALLAHKFLPRFSWPVFLLALATAMYTL